MKKIYQAPKLIVHGNLEEITQAVGPAQQNDTVFFGGQSIPVPNGGSQDFNAGW